MSIKLSWWKYAVFAAAVPLLILAAEWAEHEARDNEARRRVAELDEAEREIGCDTEPWPAEREE